MLLVFCVIFFFFKQKTAYEMRISDWSSDVCSSDLAGKVSNTKIVVPVKRTQPIERDRGRGAEVRREGDLPRPRKRCRRGDAARLDRARAERIGAVAPDQRSEEHTSELQSLMRTTYAVLCMGKTKALNNNKS